MHMLLSSLHEGKVSTRKRTRARSKLFLPSVLLRHVVDPQPEVVDSLLYRSFQLLRAVHNVMQGNNVLCLFYRMTESIAFQARRQAGDMIMLPRMNTRTGSTDSRDLSYQRSQWPKTARLRGRWFSMGATIQRKRSLTPLSLSTSPAWVTTNAHTMDVLLPKGQEFQPGRRKNIRFHHLPGTSASRTDAPWYTFPARH